MGEIYPIPQEEGSCLKIIIPFRREFKERILSGQKVMTTRKKRYGKIGDTFEAFGATFKLMAVDELRLHDVAWKLFREEGFERPLDFIQVWEKIHPRYGYSPGLTVYAHSFLKVSTEQPLEKRK
jgi:hypothetical protein